MPAPLPSGVGVIQAFLEQHGPDTVRAMLASGGLPPQFNSAARRWLADREQEVEDRDRSDHAIGLAITEQAALSAEHQAAEHPPGEAGPAAMAVEKANARATIALVVAALSIFVAIAVPLLQH